MNPDFRDLLAAFNDRGVELIVVGAYALAAHGLIRATQALFADQEAAVLSREHLLIDKRATARDQDLLDVKWLEENQSRS
jgi:hypothetical protein